MAEDERLTRLEVTVAQGFSELGGRISGIETRLHGVETRIGGLEIRMSGLEARMDALGGRIDALKGRMDALGGRMDALGGRMDRLEDRLDTMNAKLDVVSETLTDKMQLVLERLDAHAGEMRVTVKAIVEEHRADRRLMYSMLHDHGVRIRALEQATSPASAPPEAPAP